MTRYEDAPHEILNLVDKVQASWFGELKNCKIKVLYDKRKRMSGGSYVLGRIQKCSGIMRHLSRKEAGNEDGFDYILYLDSLVFNALDQADKIRLIRHELRHCFYDNEAKGDPYKLVGHDIEDFEAEMDLNKDDPKWRHRVHAVAASVHDKD